MNESVICSTGCGLPPTLNCTVPQAAGPCATASGGPPALARNVSRIPPPRGGGQEAAGHVPGCLDDHRGRGRAPGFPGSVPPRRLTAGGLVVSGWEAA
jgi:hypothetical protein